MSTDFKHLLVKTMGKDSKRESLFRPAANMKGKKARVENSKEQSVVEAFDKRRTMKRYADLITRLMDGKIDVPSALQGASADAFVQILALMTDGDNDKIRLEAARDLLDRAGFTKTQKVAVAGAIDTGAAKEELIATILGLSNKTKELEIIEDDSSEASDKEE